MNMQAALPLLSAAATYGPALMRYSKHLKPAAKGAVKLFKFVKKNPKKAKSYVSAAGKIFTAAGKFVKMAKGSNEQTSAIVQAPARPIPVTTFAPVYSGASGRRFVMHAEEFVGAVTWYPASATYATTATPGAIECLPVNPFYWTGTRVNTAIRNYQTWKVQKMSLEFVPTLGSGWAGTVALAMMPQDHAIPAAMDPVSLATSLSALPGFRTCPIQSVGLPPAARQVSASSVLCCVSCPDPVSNPVLSIVVTDLVSPDGEVPATSMNIGKLLVKYTVSMDEPCPAWGINSGISEVCLTRSDANTYSMGDTQLVQGSATANGGNLQPDFVRVCRCWTAGGTPRAPTFNSSFLVVPGTYGMYDTYSYTTADYGGWNVTSGTPLATINRRLFGTGITLDGVTKSPVVNDLKVTDRRTGLDISTILTDTLYPYRPATAGLYSMYTGWRACILPSIARGMTDVDGPVPTSTSTSYLAEITSAVTDATDPTQTRVTVGPEPAETVPMVAQSIQSRAPFLPPLSRKI